MQPYFIPYTGNCRLFAPTDIFVIYDSVQLRREGYAHRKQLPYANGDLPWLRMPLIKAILDTRIDQLAFRAGAYDELIVKFRCLQQLRHRPSDPAAVVDASQFAVAE